MASIARWPADAANYRATDPAFPTIIDPNDMRRPVVEFDQGATQAADFSFVVPAITGALTLEVWYILATATTGNIQFESAAEATTPADAVNKLTTDSFDTVNTATAKAVPGTAGHEDSQTITLTNNDSMAEGDAGVVRVLLNTTGTTAAGSAYLTHVELRDAA